ncbi:hypothetical protein ACSBR2_028586 [Camellia fascicularis]
MSLFNHHRFQKYAAKTSWNKVEKGLIPVFEHALELGTEMNLKDLFQYIFDSTCILVLGHALTSFSIGLPAVAYEKAFTDAEEPSVSHQSTQMVEDREEAFDHDLLTAYMMKNDVFGDSADKFLRDSMLNLVFAGRDTTSASLTWFFWLVATNPSVENKIREEIITKLHPKEDNRLCLYFSNINDQKMEKLVYLHGALCESLRLFPLVPIQHKASLQPDILPSGNKIGANRRMLLGFYAMGRMETIWGKDCLEFKPERRITEQGVIKREPSYKFITFKW